MIGSRVKQVRHIDEYRLELVFSDGLRADLDFRDKVIGRGGVFEPLNDTGYFRQVRVDPESGTIFWPNGVDFCPDVLYSLASGRPIHVLQPW